MGTRGLTAVVQDGDFKIAQYGQWDHYPSGQGLTALTFLRDADAVERLRAAKTRFATQEDFEAATLAAGIDPKAQFITMEESARFDAQMPFVSRDIGAKILALVADHGGEVLVKDSRTFAKDSLFCEWGYVVDLDENTFEVYQGFQKEPHNEGRFASDIGDDGYYPIKRVAVWPLDSLPTDDELLALEGAED